jgi:hypothetical protein
MKAIIFTLDIFNIQSDLILYILYIKMTIIILAKNHTNL